MPRGTITPTLYTCINAHDSLFPDIAQTVTFIYLSWELNKSKGEHM